MSENLLFFKEFDAQNDQDAILVLACFEITQQVGLYKSTHYRINFGFICANGFVNLREYDGLTLESVSENFARLAHLVEEFSFFL